jgi:hypothetical protein
VADEAMQAPPAAPALEAALTAFRRAVVNQTLEPENPPRDAEAHAAVLALVADWERERAIDRETLERAGYRLIERNAFGERIWVPPVNEKMGALYRRAFDAEDALAAAERRAEEAERDMARLDSGCIRLTLQAADGRQGILYRDVDLRAAIDDAMARTPRPERCGCFVAATGEVCTQPTDHIGPHIFASDSAARTPTPEVSTTQPEDDR